MSDGELCFFYGGKMTTRDWTFCKSCSPAEASKPRSSTSSQWISCFQCFLSEVDIYQPKLERHLSELVGGMSMTSAKKIRWTIKLAKLKQDVAALEVGGGLCFKTWKGKTTTPEHLSQALRVPIDMEGFWGDSDSETPWPLVNYLMVEYLDWD